MISLVINVKTLNGIYSSCTEHPAAPGTEGSAPAASGLGNKGKGWRAQEGQKTLEGKEEPYLGMGFGRILGFLRPRRTILDGQSCKAKQELLQGSDFLLPFVLLRLFQASTISRMFPFPNPRCFIAHICRFCLLQAAGSSSPTSLLRQGSQ